MINMYALYRYIHVIMPYRKKFRYEIGNPTSLSTLVLCLLFDLHSDDY